MYGWASPDYMLNQMTLLEILDYYDNGMRHEETLATILVGTLAKAMNGDSNETPNKNTQKQGRVYREEPEQEPDRAALYAQFGDKIKKV